MALRARPMCVILLCTRGALDSAARRRSTAALGGHEIPSDLGLAVDTFFDSVRTGTGPGVHVLASSIDSRGVTRSLLALRVCRLQRAVEPYGRAGWPPSAASHKGRGPRVELAHRVRSRRYRNACSRRRVRAGAQHPHRRRQHLCARLRAGVRVVNVLRKTASCQLPPNKQLQRTVTRWRGRGACASLHYAHAPRFTRQRAAAELRR